ncbi:IS3 family transposase [Streptomyces sp. NPDC001732]
MALCAETRRGHGGPYDGVNVRRIEIARLAVFGWAHRYNTRRRHSRLGQMSPINYENALIENSTTLSLVA